MVTEPVPLERNLSAKVAVRIHETGAVDVVLRAPWPIPDLSHRIEPEELDIALEVFEAARARRERYRAQHPERGTT